MKRRHFKSLLYSLEITSFAFTFQLSLSWQLFLHSSPCVDVWCWMRVGIHVHTKEWSKLAGRGVLPCCVTTIRKKSRSEKGERKRGWGSATWDCALQLVYIAPSDTAPVKWREQKKSRAGVCFIPPCPPPQKQHASPEPSEPQKSYDLPFKERFSAHEGRLEEDFSGRFGGRF